MLITVLLPTVFHCMDKTPIVWHFLKMCFMFHRRKSWCVFFYIILLGKLYLQVISHKLWLLMVLSTNQRLTSPDRPIAIEQIKWSWHLLWRGLCFSGVGVNQSWQCCGGSCLTPNQPTTRLKSTSFIQKEEVRQKLHYITIYVNTTPQKCHSPKVYLQKCIKHFIKKVHQHS